MSSERSLLTRARGAWHALTGEAPKPAQTGEIAFADPFRLFPKTTFTQYNPDSLVTRKGLGTYDQMRHDDQVKACMAFKKMAVTATGWTVEPPQDMDEDWEPARFVKDQLEKMPGTFNEVIRRILTALDYGFSVSEKVWAPIQDGEWAGKIGLNIKTKKPHPFHFRQDEFATILALQQEGQMHVDLPVEKFVLYANMDEFGNPYGISDLRAAYRPWWHKDHSLKWMMMLLERMGIPPLVGFYDPDTFQGTQLAQLQTMFEKLQAATNMLIPRTVGPGKEGKESFDLQFPQVAGQVSTVFIPAIKEMDTAIARALLMPGMLGLSPEQVSGSLARARTSFDVFLFVLNKLRQDMEESVVNEQIVRPLLDLNYPSLPEYPKFKLLPITDEARLDLLEQWSKLVGAGVVATTDDDEAHIRAMMDFPEREMDALTPPDDGSEQDDDDTGGDEPKPGDFKAHRAPTGYEKRCDFQSIDRYLTRQEAAMVEQWRKLLTQAQETVLNRVRRAGPTLDLIKSLSTLPNRSALRRTMQEYLLGLFEAGRREIRKELPRLFAETNGPNYKPVAAMQFLRDKAVQLAATVNQKLIAEVKDALSLSLELGETGGQASARLRDVFQPYIGDPAVLRDDEQLAPYRIENIVRTESTAAYNQGRLVEARRPGVVENMRGMEFSAILDSRTTPVCESLDGRIVPIDAPELDKFRPPLHYNCRSVLVPVTTTDEVDESAFLTPTQAGKSLELVASGFYTHEHGKDTELPAPGGNAEMAALIASMDALKVGMDKLQSAPRAEPVVVHVHTPRPGNKTIVHDDKGRAVKLVETEEGDK